MDAGKNGTRLLDGAVQEVLRDATLLPGVDMAALVVTAADHRTGSAQRRYFAVRQPFGVLAGSDAPLPLARAATGEGYDPVQLSADIDPAVASWMSDRGARFSSTLPVIMADTWSGTLSIAHRSPDPFSADEQAAAVQFLAFLRRALNRAERDLYTRQWIAAMDAAIIGGASSESALRPAAEAVLEVGRADAAIVHVLDEAMVVVAGVLTRGSPSRWLVQATAQAPYPGGPIEEIVQRRRTVVIAHLGDRANVQPDVIERGAASSVHVPVMLAGQVIGTLDAEWLTDNGATPSRVVRIEQLASHLAVAFAHVRQRNVIERQRHALEERLREQEIVAQTAAAIAATSDLDQGLRALIHGMAALTGAESGGVRLLSKAGVTSGRARLLFWRGADDYSWGDTYNLPGSNTMRAMVDGKGIYTPNLAADAEAGDPSAQIARSLDRLGSSLIVPLRAGGQVIGTLHADDRRAYAFSEEMTTPLQLLADHASGAVLQMQMRADAGTRLKRLEVAQRVSHAANAAEDLDTILQRVLQEAVAAVGAERGLLALVGADRQFVRGHVGVGVPDGLVEATVRRLYTSAHPDEDAFAIVVRTGEQRTFRDDHPAHHQQTQRQFPLPAIDRAITPISHHDNVIGAFSVARMTGPRLEPEDLSLLRLIAEQAGGAIARTRLVEMERTLLAREQEASRALASALAALEASEEQFKSAFRDSAIGMAMVDLDGQLREVNDACARIIGRTPAQLLGQSLSAYIHPDDVEIGREFRRQALSGGSPVLHREKRFVRPDGGIVQAMVSSALVNDAHAKPLLFVFQIQDITDRKRLEAERDAAVEAQARAEGAVRTGRAVAHEIGSPLSAILGLAELLASDPRLPRDVCEDILSLWREAHRSADMLRRFGQIARYEEMSTPVGPQLDVRRASEPAPQR